MTRCLGAVKGVGDSFGNYVEIDRAGFGSAQDPQAFPAGGGDQPPAQPFRVLDLVSVFGEAQPGRLCDVQRVSVLEPERAHRRRDESAAAGLLR